MTETSNPGETPTGVVDARPPYMAAGLIFLTVLAGYVFTLAPGVTFWDAGEFIAASRILGIPHPPGTPVFVLLSHVWADVVMIGSWAYRTNLMTAVFSASSAALFFLVVVQALRNKNGDPLTGTNGIFSMGGAAAAAVVSAFVFTVWQNSNETEVYMVSAFAIAASAWLGYRWRDVRGTSRASHFLLLIVYLQAFSVGNHLLTLLVGPAILVFLFYVVRNNPLENPEERAIEWAQFYVMCGMWALLVGVGLGSSTLFFMSGFVFLVAAGYAAMTGGVRFAVVTLLVGAVGVSTYYFLYVRAGLSPIINEADPSTFDRLLSVIRREQYPPRQPWDNPLEPSGPGNTGRTMTLILLQIQNYLQYFDWQWSNGLAATKPVFAAIRLPFTLLFTSIGIYGMLVLRERDRAVFWMLFMLWLITGPGLVGYMNFKPGYSLGYDLFPSPGMHEVRERDYFFTVSFQAWGLFVGIGIAGLFNVLRQMVVERTKDPGKHTHLVPAPLFLLALVPFALNFNAASRAHGPEADLAHDFAYNLLQTVEPYGIVFTNGDNDTFPLWYAQEVAGIRQDVSVVNLSLGNTDWYIRQLRDMPVREFDPQQAPWFADQAPASPPGALHDWTDEQIDGIFPRQLSSDLNFRAGQVQQRYPAGYPMLVKDVLTLKLIQHNLTQRPIYFSVTAGQSNWMGLDRYVTQEGLAVRLHVDSMPAGSNRWPQGFFSFNNGRVPVNMSRTDSLAWHVYEYAGLFEPDSLDLDPTSNNIATNLALPFITLGQGYLELGDTEGVLRNFRRAYQLSPSPSLRAMIQSAEAFDPEDLFGDTALTETLPTTGDTQ